MGDRLTKGFVQVWLDGRAIVRRIQLNFSSSLTEYYSATEINISKRIEIRLDVMGGRNSTITPAQSLFR